ncbi:prepilin-type N-terminal cleavage/methylation domain-containing protein [Duganella sp. FT92W]|uniref:Prepilin-type N-terminal cleavage/methylation domain-containing protein n=1 Tax=Pseudoduganella rivuli TaxID=2666085 RepID=A0A7X2IKG4_9BURK|nr:prepilin-type N-terminal cleavage/methylation domain-containing protein [Pseudoduganella rivuli]MRV71484.1 prepilin-type N-terminal cleavage/methylation domain-containing protein [Pseudoduganella rivuli]
MKRPHGFTLVELIVVMVIIGVLAGSITIYFGPAIQNFLDVRRRANLTDLADGAVRTMTRDIRSAVSNSIHTPDTSCFELVPTSAGGRYRAAPDTGYDATHAANTTKWVNTMTTTTQFDVLSQLTTAPAVGDFVVINNQDSTNVYTPVNSTSRSTITGVAVLPATDNIGTYRLDINALRVDVGYDNARFVIVPAAQQAVFYVCSGANGIDSNGDGKGTLYRFSGYGFSINNTCPTPGANTPIVATKIQSCTFVYDPNSNNSGLNTGYMQIKLQLTESNQSVQIVVGTHTDNTP